MSCGLGIHEAGSLPVAGSFCRSGGGSEKGYYRDKKPFSPVFQLLVVSFSNQIFCYLQLLHRSAKTVSLKIQVANYVNRLFKTLGMTHIPKVEKITGRAIPIPKVSTLNGAAEDLHFRAVRKMVHWSSVYAH